MADDIKVNASTDGAAPAVATDEIGGKHYQKIKAGWGADGTWNEADEADGKRLPVRVGMSSLTMTHTAPTATTTTGAMLASNVNRRYALLQNIGAVTVYIKIGVAAVASQGIALDAGGGFYEMSVASGNLSTGAINGITATSSGVVLVTEGV